MNTQQMLLMTIGLAAFFGTWAVVGVLIYLAPRIGLVDRPNERSMHVRATPRGGGIGFVIAILVSLGALIVGVSRYLLLENAAIVPAFAVYLVGALFIAGISLRDDFKSLGSGVRLFFQVGAAAAAVIGVDYFSRVSLGRGYELDLGLVGIALTMLWLVGLTNVYNFMDGIDGLAGVQGMIAGLVWTMAGFAFGLPHTVLIGMFLAAGCAGFLVYNWSPAMIFMGDVGSAFLGYTFAVLPLLMLSETESLNIAINPGTLPLFAMLVMWPFIGDGFFTFLRRAIAREPVLKPHRSHLYQRLARSGWSHAQVCWLYSVWAVLSGGLAMAWLQNPSLLTAAVSLSGALLSLGALYWFVTRRERRKAPAHA
jgi:UDP-N-acetylmuramyl pentapeptide phosphotransferase/UDP-N-acetylglucosamine-1-phosphate transferase